MRVTICNALRPRRIRYDEKNFALLKKKKKKKKLTCLTARGTEAEARRRTAAGAPAKATRGTSLIWKANLRSLPFSFLCVGEQTARASEAARCAREEAAGAQRADCHTGGIRHRDVITTKSS